MADDKKDDAPEQQAVDPFVGFEDDDLSDMEYIQDETTKSTVETHPPETDEEAEELAAARAAEEKAAAEKDDGESEKADEEAAEQEAEPETAEAEEEPEKDVLDEDGDKVPHARFEEVNQRMKAAEDKVRKLEKQLETVVEDKSQPKEPEPDPYDFDAKEQEAADALLEGDNEKYAALRKEIRQAEREDFLREAKQIASENDQQLRETLTFEEVGTKIEAEYPQFVEGSDEFNGEAYDELMDLYVGYAKSGKYNRAQALQRAADRAAKLYDLTASGEEPASEPKEDKVVNIKKASVKDKAKAAESQPPVMESGDSAREEPSLDVKSMSDDQFAALPESTKKRLRGDIV